MKSILAENTIRKVVFQLVGKTKQHKVAKGREYFLVTVVVIVEYVGKLIFMV